ncbi:unnamed protein product [Heterobilharzia americana]|nr:unnamed protein product [Heterobilharzia americana]
MINGNTGVWHLRYLLLLKSSEVQIFSSFILLSTIILMFCIQIKLKFSSKKSKSINNRNELVHTNQQQLVNNKGVDNGTIYINRNSGQNCMNLKGNKLIRNFSNPQSTPTCQPSPPLLPPRINHLQQQSSCKTINGNILTVEHLPCSEVILCNQKPLQNNSQYEDGKYLSGGEHSPFTTWLMKIKQGIRRWKDSLVGKASLNTSTRVNYCSNPMNGNCVRNHSMSVEDISMGNSLKTISSVREEEGVFQSLHIKRKANSMKEGDKNANVNGNSNTRILQSYSNIGSMNPISDFHPSTFHHFKSQSDFFDPIYSVIKYSMKETPQSTCSFSLCNYSASSINQCCLTDRLLTKDIWTSQDSIVSDTHVYCELIKLKADKNIFKLTRKQINSFSDFYTDQSSISSTVEMMHSNQPPRLPIRNYGESTLNMVENVRLWTLRNQQRCLRNIRKVNKIHKHIQSMLDMTWKLDGTKYYQEFRFRKMKDNLRNSSCRTSVRRYKHYFGKRIFPEQSSTCHQRSTRNLSQMNTRSVFSESDAAVSLENFNSPNYRGSLNRRTKNQMKQIISGCHSNDAFYPEIDVQSTEKPLTFNDLFNNLRHIDSEVDISEIYPYRNKSSVCIQSPSKHLYNPLVLNQSYTPLYHIYIPNNNDKPIKLHSEENFNCFNMNESNFPYNRTDNYSNIDLSERYKSFPGGNMYPSSLCMPPLMERSMEDDEYQMYKLK